MASSAPPPPARSSASSSTGAPRVLDPPRPKSALVIGGGAAGVVALRNLLQHGPNDAPPPFDRVELVERRANIGGVWHLDAHTLELEHAHPNHHADGRWPISTDPRTQQPTDRPHWPSPAYPQLRGNVLPPFLSFSDFTRFPRPANDEPFPTLSETHDYLRAFADRAPLGAGRPAGLRPYIRLQTEVVGLVQLPPHPVTRQPGGWAVRIAEWSNNQAGRVHTEHWDAVVLATAWYDNPVYPRTPGIDRVRAVRKLVHAKWYRSPLPYQRKRVVIVGNGNSSNDIAAHLAALKPLPGPGVTGIDAEPIYRSIKHPALANFVSLPDERIRDVAFIEKYTVREDDVVDVHLNDGTVIKDVDLVILGVGYGYGYRYAHLLKEDASHHASELDSVPSPATHMSRFVSWDPIAFVHAHSTLFETATEDEQIAQLPVPTPSDGSSEDLAHEAAEEAALSESERAEPVARIKNTFLHVLSTHRGGNSGTLAFVGLTTVFWPFVVADFASRVIRAIWDGSAPAEVAISDRDETVQSNDPEKKADGDLNASRAPSRPLRIFGNTQLAREREERARVRDLQKKRALLRQVEAQRRADAAAALARASQSPDGSVPEADKSLFQTAPDLMTKYHCPGNDEIAYIHTLRTIILAARPDLELERGVYEVPPDALAWREPADALWAAGGREVAGRGVGLLRADDEALRRRNASPQIKLETLWAARRRLEAAGLYGKVPAEGVQGKMVASLDNPGVPAAAAAATTLEKGPIQPGAEAERQAAIRHQQGGVEGALPAALAGLSLAEGQANGSSAGTHPAVKAEWRLGINGSTSSATSDVPPAKGSLEVSAPDEGAAPTTSSAFGPTLAALDKAREVLNSTLTGWIDAVGKEDGSASSETAGPRPNGTVKGTGATEIPRNGESHDGDEQDGDEDEEEEDGGDDGNVHRQPPAAAVVAH